MRTKYIYDRRTERSKRNEREDMEFNQKARQAQDLDKDKATSASRGLLCAVVMQALSDCGGGLVPEYNGIILSQETIEPYLIRQARAWFNTKQCRDTCELAGFDHSDVVRTAQAITSLALPHELARRQRRRELLALSFQDTNQSMGVPVP